MIYYCDYQFDCGYTRFIYQTSFIKENQIYFPKLIRFQDPPFFVRALFVAKEFYALKKATYVYRVGYKTINWTKDRVRHLLKGLLFNLAFSYKNKLHKLHFLTYCHIIGMLEIIKPFKDDQVVRMLLRRINSNINEDLMCKYRSNSRNYFKRMDWIREDKDKLSYKIFHIKYSLNGRRRVYVLGIKVLSFKK